MNNIDSLVRENIRQLKPYSCARDEFGGTASVYLDANENPYGNLNRYPDPMQRNLKAEIAAKWNTDYEKIFIGNGSDEIIDLCYRTFCNPGSDKALIFIPTYGMYEVMAAVNDTQVIRIPLNDSFQIDMNGALAEIEKSRPKLIFICSPNNPTGNSINSEDIESITASATGIVVLDEAYIDFSDKPSHVPLTDKYRNLVVMQTFSKAFGMASARVGMAFADQALIRYFNKIKYPYNVSTLSQRAALDRLRNLRKKDMQVKAIRNGKSRLAEEISSLPYVKKIFPSDANFLLVRVEDPDYIYESLLKLGIVTRNRSSVISGCIRITVGTREENRQLINALKSIAV